MSKIYSVAVDGPSGAGKSTLSKAVAAELGIVYVDTGALYRTIGLYVYNKGIEKHENEKIIACLDEIDLKLEFKNAQQSVILNGSDVGDSIRTQNIAAYASAVSAIPEVREFLLDTQRNIAKTSSIVMDGRDIGTVIFPDAEVKIFLFASNEIRAERRYKELVEKGIQTTYEEVLSDMLKRDENDRTRAIAPAVPADDAIMLDSSYLNIDETISEIIRIIKEKIQL